MARGPRRYVALAAAVLLVAGGCGSDASLPSPPSGVDELVIPTPSPDPADFVATVDNPWLPLAPGSSWTYGARGDVEGTVTVTVLPDQEVVAGVTTTAVRRTGADGAEQVDRYAQDRRGNVWWFGRDGQWRAGEDGAEAGLAMPATPRLGDGWRAAYDAGVVDVRATVSGVGESVTTPAGRFEDLVAIETRSGIGAEALVRSYYAQGTGLVEQVALEGPVSLLELETGPSAQTDG